MASLLPSASDCAAGEPSSGLAALSQRYCQERFGVSARGAGVGLCVLRLWGGQSLRWRGRGSGVSSGWIRAEREAGAAT